MCHLSIAVDQSVHTVGPVFDAIDRSAFYIRSIRVLPVAWSRRADVHLSLGGGSNRDLDHLPAEDVARREQNVCANVRVLEPGLDAAAGVG